MSLLPSYQMPPGAETSRNLGTVAPTQAAANRPDTDLVVARLAHVLREDVGGEAEAFDAHGGLARAPIETGSLPPIRALGVNRSLDRRPRDGSVGNGSSLMSSV